MKTIIFNPLVILLMATTQFTLSTAQGFINIQNIYDVGINLGYISSHSQAGTGALEMDNWVTNAKAEWTASIAPTPNSLVLPKPYPGGLSSDIQNIEFRLMILRNACPNPWFRSAKSIFLAGLSLARSYVIAGGACTGCLRDEMILASIYLEDAATELIQNGLSEGTELKDLAANLKSSALAMKSKSTASRAAQQNFALASGILSAQISLDTLLNDSNITCSGNTSGATTDPEECEEVHRNHYVFNAGLAVGMLNYAAMIDVPVEQIATNGRYIDEAIKNYQKSCCLDATYLIDLKKRIRHSTSTRAFYQEITDHLTSIGPELAGCHCEQVNSTSIYSAGIALGWAEFAAHEDVAGTYVASAYLETAITHLKASNCLDPATFIHLQNQMARGGSSKPFYSAIQENRIKLSDQTISQCDCADEPNNDGGTVNVPPVVERTSLCGNVNEAGGDAPERHTIQFNETNGTFTFSYNTLSIPDRMQVFNGKQLLFDSDCVGTEGWVEKKLNLVGSNQVIVNIIPNCDKTSSTEWYFKVSCPGEVVTTNPGTGNVSQPTGFEPGTTDKNPSATRGSTASSASSTSTTIPQAPTGPKKGEWWYPVEKNHPWLGKNLEEIKQLGGVLRMYVGVSMGPDNYYLTDLDGNWINFNPGTHGPDTYYYVDWTAFNEYYSLEKVEPILNDGDVFQSSTYARKDGTSKSTFRVYRQPEFNPQASFGPEVFNWAIGKAHPWYGKTENDLKDMGLEPVMYFANSMAHNTNIYKDPFGQLISTNYNWNTTMYVLDWNRFSHNHTKISEDHMAQSWKHNIKGNVKYLRWL